MSEEFSTLLEESISKLQVKPGTIINGTVIDIKKDLVIVNAGLKSEGMIPIDQFIGFDGKVEVQEGDTVEVSVDAIEDGFGETKLSREKAKKARAWVSLTEAFENKQILEGRITGKVKGGFTVDLADIKAFLPGSLVDVRPVRETTYLEGKDLEFIVIKIDKKRNNVVVSRKAVLETENSDERDELISNLEEDSVVKGIVKNITDYGAFLDLGGVDGLLHITDISWSRVTNPSEVLSLGQEIDVKILSFDKEKLRVSLGLKQIQNDPWETIEGKYSVGGVYEATVSNLTDYGCFAELEQGVEGLIHLSELDWTNKNIHPSKVVDLEEKIKVMVLEIDHDKRRISLGLKQTKANPWTEFANKYGLGDAVEGNIKSVTDFGIFVGLEGDIDGLIHLSDITEDENPAEAMEKFKKGDKLSCIIFGIDAERERISLKLSA